MRARGVGRAIGYGFLSLFLVQASAVFGFVAAYAGSSDGSFSEPTNANRAVALAGLLLVPVALVLAGALPARALGLGWSASLAVSGGVFVALLVAVIALGTSNGAVVTASVAAPALVALSTSVLTGRPWAAAVVVVLAAAAPAAASYAAFPADVVASFNAGAAGWVLLPAVAALFRPRSGAEAADRRTSRERASP